MTDKEDFSVKAEQLSKHLKMIDEKEKHWKAKNHGT
jgi:hypothetical protein